MDGVVGFSVEMSEHSGSERETIHGLRILKLASNMEGAQETGETACAVKQNDA